MIELLIQISILSVINDWLFFFIVELISLTIWFVVGPSYNMLVYMFMKSNHAKNEWFS
jgi:predicted Abi (CAAX) family protease